jgi:HAD superfamily hydrolase (TIGR01456 family)
MKNIGVVCDIDGVLLRGDTVLAGSAEGLALLEEHNIPFIFVTNGGGKSETEKSRSLSEKLSTDIRSDQVILCHTPFQSFSQYFDKNILVIGDPRCCDVARSYGFQRPVTCHDILNKWPTVYPGPVSYSSTPSTYLDEDPEVHAAFIFHDPVHWGFEMQVLTDVLLGQLDGTRPGTVPRAQRAPLFISNMDLTYATEHPFQRFTQGAFVLAFQTIFEQYCGFRPEITFCGKPYKIQYDYAVKVLDAHARKTGSVVDGGALSCRRYFMIGDNPKSDIRGARAAGPAWTSILVRSGVFQGENDPTDPADIVVDNFLIAVKNILEISGLGTSS